MIQKTLSEKIISSVRKIILQWLKDNPDYPLLNIAQQLNYSSVILRTLGSKAEEEYKAKYKPKYGSH